MSLADFVALVSPDLDAVLALAGVMALGIFAVVQTVKVLGLLANDRQTAFLALGVGAVELVLVVLGYFFPAAIPVGLFIFGAALALAAAVNGYKYAFKPFISKLFPDAEISTEDLAPTAKKTK